MPFTPDAFDGVMQSTVADVAPGLIDVITRSLAAELSVSGVSIRMVLVAADGFATVRWAADCTDTIRNERYKTDRDVTVHGVSVVGPSEQPGGEPLVLHSVDWAGVMGQLGMTTSRPTATDPDRAAAN